MTYQEAISLLQRRRRPFSSKSATPPPPSSNVPRAPNAPTLEGIPTLEGVKDWLLLLGHNDDDIDRLNVIHVAGTKGKGSTCAYVDCFLREHAKRNSVNRKIGFYSSSSLWPRNIIRIDSHPIPEDLFATRIGEASRGLSLDSNAQSLDAKSPGFLQMMAIASFHMFIKEGVDVVICEAHNGGEFDITNFIRRPAITAITKIGIDHEDNLEQNIRDTAWHKSGIFKAGVLALSVRQDPEAERVMKARAIEKEALLQFVEDARIRDTPLEKQENCALAIQVADAFLQFNDQSLDTPDILAGIERFRWHGHFDIGWSA